MSWHYGPVGSSVWTSKKFQALPSDEVRLSYIYLLTCRHANGLGVFRLPDIYLAADRKVDAFKAAEHLEQIEAAGLIERDEEDDMVRVVGWFHADTGAANPSTVSSFCKLLSDTRIIKRSDLRSRAMAEMLWASMPRAENWNPSSAPFERMQQDINRLLRGEVRNDLARTKTAFLDMPPPEKDGLLHTLLDTLSHTVSDTLYHTEPVPTPELAIAPALAPALGLAPTLEDETPFSADGASDPPSTPPKGRRSGRKKVDPDTQAAIEELTAKAAGKK